MKKKMKFNNVSTKVSFPEIEKEILNFWEKEQIFQKSLENSKKEKEFVFYDGPPFATGLPHYGHLLAGTIKDVIPRYQTMRGRFVDRVFGWDCHGLPVEYEMEKELALSGKREIEEYGIEKFNEACRSIVLRYTAEWETVVKRMGRWVDFRRGYRTMDLNYMESIWWVFKQLWEKGLIYEGFKVLPYCPRCSTPLSNFEANQGYKEVEDPAITIKFQDINDTNLSYLVWTTTPWTLPSNMALALGPELDYVEIEDNGERFILAQERLSAYYKDNSEYKIIRKYKPDVIFTHYKEDKHRDHRAVWEITDEARWKAAENVLADFGTPWYTPELYYYEVIELFTYPSLLIDITDTLERKVEAMKTQSSQFPVLPGVIEYIEGLGKVRGYLRGTKYAEAFLSSNFIARLE